MQNVVLNRVCEIGKFRQKDIIDYDEYRRALRHPWLSDFEQSAAPDSGKLKLLGRPPRQPGTGTEPPGRCARWVHSTIFPGGRQRKDSAFSKGYRSLS
jgi:hypothetical protein